MTNVGEERPAQGPRRCAKCEGSSFEEGFVEDMGQSSQGYAHWIPGQLERGLSFVAEHG